MPGFRGNNELAYNIFVLLFEGHFRKVLQGFLRNRFYHQVAFAFLYMARLGT
jgi:hypothetical protein